MASKTPFILFLVSVVVVAIVVADDGEAKSCASKTSVIK
jgi:hypothetical protein